MRGRRKFRYDESIEEFFVQTADTVKVKKSQLEGYKEVGMGDSEALIHHTARREQLLKTCKSACSPSVLVILLCRVCLSSSVGP